MQKAEVDGGLQLIVRDLVMYYKGYCMYEYLMSLMFLVQYITYKG